MRNNATLEGWSPSPNSTKETARDADVVALPLKMEISVERRLVSVSASEGLNSGYCDVGDFATFEVTIQNTGNMVLSTVVLTDSMTNAGNYFCNHEYSTADSKLLPTSNPSGVVIVCNVTVPVTESHVDAGGFSGTSEVSRTREDTLSRTNHVLHFDAGVDVSSRRRALAPRSTHHIDWRYLRETPSTQYIVNSRLVSLYCACC